MHADVLAGRWAVDFEGKQAGADLYGPAPLYSYTLYTIHYTLYTIHLYTYTLIHYTLIYTYTYISV